MNEVAVVKEFFSGLRCSECNEKFVPESVSILRQESNYTVVRVQCSGCKKNIGMAILGLDRNAMKKTLHSGVEATQLELFKKPEGDTPIDYDDVIDAHEFISNMGSDWNKYLPES